MVATSYRVVSMKSKDSSSPPQPHPAVSLLLCERWDDAFGLLHDASEETVGPERAQRLLDKCGDRAAIQEEIRETIDAMYKLGTHRAGELALAWSMMTCRATYPASFRSVLPQLQYALDAADLDANDDCDCRDRLRFWWQCGAGEFAHEKRSPFAIAAALLGGEIEKESLLETPASDVDVVKWFRTSYPGPTLTVMPAKATKLNNYNKGFAEILDKRLPLVCARNLDDARKRLSYEFPHASAAISMLFKDLREGEPIKLRATILLGSPGCGKSRMVRKFASAIGIQHVHRYDGASSSDGQFAGTSKGWSNTEASVPARAVLASRTANPLVFVDEIDKATSNHHGGLINSITGYLDRETSKFMRDQSTDCVFDLSMVSYLATANDVSGLPEHIRDRFRILRMPAPRLVDLPLLAASIVDAMLLEEGDEWAGSVAPFPPDELRVMGKAWERAGFSLRKLQVIVRATLEARDACQMRH